MTKRLVHGKAVDLGTFEARVLQVAIAAVKEQVGHVLCGGIDASRAPLCRAAYGAPCSCKDVAEAVLKATDEAAYGRR